MKIEAGATNVSLFVYFVDDVGGTNAGEPTTGLLFSDIETGGSASYARQGAARVDLTLITLASASAAHADGGFILVDDTNMPGVYRVDYPDAAFATGVDMVVVQMVAAGAKNTVMRPLWVELGTVQTDLDNGTDGLGALKSAIDTVDDFLDTEIAAITAAVITNATGADVAADIIAMKAETALIVADTNELQTDNVPGLIATLDAVVDTVKAETVLIVADTGELQTDWANGGRLDLLLDAVNTTTPLTAAQVNTEVDTALTDIHLDHLLAADYDPATPPGVATALLNELIESNAGVSRYTAAALAQAPSGGASAASIADAVWDEAQADHVAAGSFGLIASEIADILADTNELQGDWVNSGRLDLIIDAILVDTATTIPASITIIDDFLDTEIAAITAAVITNAAGADIAADIIALKAETALIVADTNELQGDWVNGGRLDLIFDIIAADVVNIDGAAMRGTDSAGTAVNLATVDTVVDAIKVITDQFVFTKANEVDANTQSINGATVVGDGNASPWDGA